MRIWNHYIYFTSYTFLFDSWLSILFSLGLNLQDRPAVGLYCVGLYLYGAQWDRKRAILAPR